MKTGKEKNIIVGKAFIMFLKANNALIPYKRAIYHTKNHSRFDYYLRILKDKDEMMNETWRRFIFNAFIWGDTIECRRKPLYWSDLHSKWIGILEQLIYDDYEISKVIPRIIITSRQN